MTKETYDSLMREFRVLEIRHKDALEDLDNAYMESYRFFAEQTNTAHDEIGGLLRVWCDVPDKQTEMYFYALPTYQFDLKNKGAIEAHNKIVIAEAAVKDCIKDYKAFYEGLHVFCKEEK